MLHFVFLLVFKKQTQASSTGRAKEQYMDWVAAEAEAAYEEAQSRLRMSMLCHDAVRPLTYPLFMHIVELAVAICDSSHSEASNGG